MTRTKLKEAALRLFGQKGYDGTALSEIAKEVGVKTPAIYAFFESKEDLFMSVFEESMSVYNEYIQAMAETSKGMSTEKKLHALLVRQYDFHRNKRELAVFAFRYLLFPPDFLLDRMQEAFGRFDTMLSDIIREIMQEGLERGELAVVPIENLVDSYLTLMDGLSIQYYYYQSPELFERKLKHAFEMFWRSVSA
ncbi:MULTISPECIES: TetR/AcrR family transcriptional regulator [Paenibacillus]|uniref:TetR family transcriptional regulator n=1 Tax=Paenibacillus campinasensis TaxID=66347 RepID=A0A268EED3_9BACL|nr:MULTISPECIES: TetR/AcrR family transcriptional regulator [Paenibacillus]MUG68495.1 TetR family transcriptional regulator [Paenibacillus campinasensis]PAD71485.1 TetR family transcriptional regulator [Paenibacillus campinasensis]PAK47995.1 TetR family transcriptional regulator [Paenibacillus sp. 7541]